MWKTLAETHYFKANAQLWYKQSEQNALTVGTEFFAKDSYIPIDTDYCLADMRIVRGNNKIQSLEIGESSEYADGNFDINKLSEYELNYLMELRVSLKELKKLNFIGVIPENCRLLEISNKKKEPVEFKGLALLGKTLVKGIDNGVLTDFLTYASAGAVRNDAGESLELKGLTVENFYLLSHYYRILYSKIANLISNLEYVSSIKFSTAENVIVYGEITPEIYLDSQALESKIKHDIITIRNSVKITKRLTIYYYVLTDDYAKPYIKDMENIHIEVFIAKNVKNFNIVDENIRQAYIKGVEEENRGAEN